ncbi:Baseplate assembly protein J [Qipengyuania citrea LAMA 915]|uniref:Baseplate assembly protein J n=1 Tax=Qipengyuania citrea LAMA 915 TaxID=1306953 RepID=A0A0L1KFG6_9SPHN|nr:baseplate J/gp47 family protein [Qipengyuania citrea]KNH02614.1 Baseplate assembly protein J [Qipengyuania citrea LAMA 915]
MLAPTKSIASSTAIDLSRLPAPDIIEPLDFEVILADRKADFLARFPQFSAFVESDPVMKLLEAAAYQELILRQRINDAAHGVMIAFAKGADLDNLAAFFGVVRRVITPANEETGALAVMESDDDLRRRVLLAPDSYSVAGPTAAYQFHALSASGDVADVSAISPAPGEVLISVLSRQGDGTASPELLDLVEAVVGADDVRPLTDQVSVQSVEIVDFAVTAKLTIYRGPDADLILKSAQDGLTAMLKESRLIGRDIARSAIFQALHTAGVQSVALEDPVSDIVIGDTQVAAATAVAVTIAGVAE